MTLMKDIKLNTDPSTFTTAETTLMSQAEAVNAPIAVALRQNNQSWKRRIGQRNTFVDLRTNQKISIFAASQIVLKCQNEAMHQMFQQLKTLNLLLDNMILNDDT